MAIRMPTALRTYSHIHSSPSPLLSTIDGLFEGVDSDLATRNRSKYRVQSEDLAFSFTRRHSRSQTSRRPSHLISSPRRSISATQVQTLPINRRLSPLYAQHHLVEHQHNAMDAHDFVLPSAPPHDLPLLSSTQSAHPPSDHPHPQEPQPQNLGGGIASAPPAPPLLFTDAPATCIKVKRIYRCYACKTTTTTVWRRSAKTPGKVVCNRCGLLERTKCFRNPVRVFDPAQSAPATPALRNPTQRTRTAHPYAGSRTSRIGAHPAPGPVSDASLAHRVAIPSTPRHSAPATIMDIPNTQHAAAPRNEPWCTKRERNTSCRTTRRVSGDRL